MDRVIEGYAINNAYEMSMEERLGSLEGGKLAGLDVFKDNLFEIETYAIHETKIHEAIVDGATRHKA